MTWMGLIEIMLRGSITQGNVLYSSIYMNFQNRQNISTDGKTKHFIYCSGSRGLTEKGHKGTFRVMEISFWSCLLPFYRNEKKIFCILILYSVTLINSSVSSRFFLYVFGRSLRYLSAIMLSIKKDNFLSLF